MSLPPETARIHFEYTRWASRLIVEAAAALPEEELNRDHKTSDKSVLGTLVHVFAGDRVWLGRVTGSPVAKFMDPEADMKLSVLQIQWPEIHERWLRHLSTAALDEVIEYRDLKGNPHRTPLWQILLHVINHGTHHRGMVAAMMRSMGRTPPQLDEIFYFRTL